MDLSPFPFRPLFGRLANKFLQPLRKRLAGVAAQVDDSTTAGWNQLWGQPNDRSQAEVAGLYRDALEATRKNPIAKAIVDITTDFVLGDGIRIGSTVPSLDRFLVDFWNHPKNRIDRRLQAMSDELCRAGDLFVLLFRNPQDGMSYIRFVTKEQIVRIDTADNDWETEVAYHQQVENSLEPRVWLSPHHPEAAKAEAIMLHYAVNRPVGASFGEGDLDTIIPWLLRYSRMLEDRVRLHWAVRSFLWFVTVPTNLVESKQAQYRRPPEAGSLIIKDDGEEWEVKSPNLRGSDARHDLQAVRHMIDAAGYPPHWRGEGGDANLATAQAMQLRPERHLRRRQNTLVFMLQDLIYHAYSRAYQIGKVRARPPEGSYESIFTVDVADISRADNAALAQAARDITAAFDTLFSHIPATESGTLTRLALRLIFKFAGEPQRDEVLSAILGEASPAGKRLAGSSLAMAPVRDGEPVPMNGRG